MHPVVRSVWCPDIDLTDPPAAESTTLSVPLRFMIAPSTSGAEEAFDVLVCSVEWLQHQIQLSGPRTGAGLHIVDEWDIPDAVRTLSRRIVTTSADSWPELRSRLASFLTTASASRVGEHADDRPDLTELRLPPSEPRLCASTIALVGALVYDFPALTEVLQDFVDAFEEVLPHVLMPDIIEFITRDDRTDLARGVFGWLDTAYAWGDADQRNLIDISAVDAIPATGEPGSHLRDLLGAHLRRRDHWLDPHLAARDDEASHRFQIASFVEERDGLALELVDAATGETIAEVFRDDSDETASSRPLTFQCFASQPLDLALAEVLLRKGRLGHHAHVEAGLLANPGRDPADFFAGHHLLRLDVLRWQHIELVLDAFTRGGIDASLLEDWAEAVQGSDLIRFDDANRDRIAQAIFELSTPGLHGGMQAVVHHAVTARPLPSAPGR